MRTILLSLILCLTTIYSFSQTSKTVHSTSPGTLYLRINSTEQNTIVNLTVTGNINAIDFAFIRDKIKLLSKLDLSGANINAYSGTDGTYKGEQIEYPANELPHYAFYNPVLLSYKPTLTNVVLPTNITSIGYLAFYYCWNITFLQIPAFVTNIYDYAFYGCYSIQSISVSSGNTRYSANAGVLYNKGQDTLLVCPNAKSGSLTIPSTVKHIGKSAFENCFNISTITLPNSLQSIDSYAFANCSGISGNLNIPVQVKFLGDGAFYGCYNLNGNVYIPASLTNIGSSCFLESNNIAAFEVNANNQNFSDSNNMLMSKNRDTLFICPPAKSEALTIPNSVKLIGSHAFYNCVSLTGNIQIPENVDYIGYYAFLGCLNIESYSVDTQNQFFISDDGVLFSKTKDRLLVCPPYKSGEFILPPNLESIDPGAFNNCKNITGYIHFPASFQYLGDYAFYNCLGISGFSVDENNLYFSDMDGVLFNKAKDYLYLSFTNLSGSYKVPSTVKEIGYSAFDGCSKLTDIEIPSSVLTIGAYAFEYCINLQNVHISENVSYIGSSAFYGCSNLQNLRIAVPEPPIVDYFTFENTGMEKSTLTVPVGSKSLYTNAPYWGNFRNISEDQFNTALTKTKVFPYFICKTKTGILIHHLNPSDEIEIYSLQGKLIKKVTALANLQEIHFPLKGIFIIKIQGFTEKIIL
ncbi:hypothetical protein MASR2M117_22010 [Paludibacter sp.]